MDDAGSSSAHRAVIILTKHFPLLTDEIEPENVTGVAISKVGNESPKYYELSTHNDRTMGIYLGALVLINRLNSTPLLCLEIKTVEFVCVLQSCDQTTENVHFILI